MLGWSTADGSMLAANSQRVHGWSLRWMHDGYDGPTSVVRLWCDCYMMAARQERQRTVTGATFLSISSELIRRNTMLNQWPSEGRRHSCKVTRWHPMPTNFVPRHHRATVVSLWKGEIKVWSSFPVFNTTTKFHNFTRNNHQYDIAKTLTSLEYYVWPRSADCRFVTFDMGHRSYFAKLWK